ncbi:hypothetical protein BJY01DRAFT_214039 [Aspergillus pseudoustus]|uniref:RanBD1 domain-containing protein n=1 Tax=Aspergillus pseudoustus TaxID=1810923 RepID=A0ABR4K000_9EURO
MSKRSAQGPQGDKDSNLLDFNMQSTPDDKPTRATAAQLANRKIKDIRRRPRAGSPAGSASASFGGPFSSLDPNTVSSTSAGSQPATNGFSFGQSQSFPPASAAPQPPTQNGGSQFAFGSGGGSPAFNFSGSFGGTTSTPASNPFASMNTGATKQPTSNNFTGFKGNMFNIPSTASQSPAQQPLPSGGLFGATSQPNSTAGGFFGNTATSGPSSQPGTITPPNGSMFGQSNTGAPSGNMFGQSGPEKPNPFVQTTALSNDSMQTSPDAKSAAQKPFSSGSGGFGISTNFGGSGTGTPLFGGTSSAPSSQTSSKPLFGAKPTEQVAPAPSALFGVTTQPTFSAPTTAASSSTALTAGTASSSLFGGSTPKTTTTSQNPFQSSSIFGAPTSQVPSTEKAKEETKPTQLTPSQPSLNFSSSTTGPSPFSKSESQASSQPSTLFQAPATGSLFAPKPPSSSEQEKPKEAQGNPFSSLFVPKPPATGKPATEQKPLPSPSLFAPKPASAEGSTANETPNSTTAASPFSTSTAARPSSTAPQSSGFSLSTPPATTAAPAPAFTPSAATSHSPFNTNGIKTASSGPTLSEASQTLDKIKPARMPSGLGAKTEQDVEMANRVRVLNESFRREIAKTDLSKEGFDALVVHYLRVRETIGSPLEGVAGMKRKTSDDSGTAINPQPSKKSKPFGTAESTSPAGSLTPNKAASPLAPATGNKRKAAVDTDDVSSTPQPAKRPSGGSTTASIFANSFSNSRTSESTETAGAESPKRPEAPSFKPATPEPAKPSLFSTTPTSSPPKPLFPAPTATKETSAPGSTPSQAAPAFKPTFNPPASSTSPANPFVIKPSGGKDAGQPSAPLAIPKFGSGNTDFFAQFKAQSDKEAKKEKEKRKDEDFDSDEDDEEEWERKDAENQRKKHEAIIAQQNKRAIFVPGQGFSFEEDNSTDAEKSDVSAGSSMVSNSVFDAKSTSFGKSSNIFGHLSATPSEGGEDEQDDANDTEEASDAGDDAARESSFTPTEDLEASNADSKGNGVTGSSAAESSDEGDFTKALKKSKQTDSSDQTNEATTEPSSGSRSLFDRVQYDQEGKPKRHEDDGKTVSSLLGSSKYASSFNSAGSTPNPFASLSQPQSDKGDDSAASKPALPNIFGSSSITANPFGTSSSGTSTPSILGSSTAKPGSDNTWKLNTPIKFAADSPKTTESTAKSTSDSAPASGSSQPFSALFGPTAAGSKSGSGAQQPLGFSFGGPSQPSSSFLTPSALTSATPSRASTPGVASDTGADDSADGDAAESLPQVDLARSRAGEENEDIVFECRARALKLNTAWDSQGIGNVRVLKDRTTSRGRVLMRADPSGNVILNTVLQKAISYKLQGTSVQFLIPKTEGPPEMWGIRTKPAVAAQLATAMEETKS